MPRCGMSSINEQRAAIARMQDEFTAARARRRVPRPDTPVQEPQPDDSAPERQDPATAPDTVTQVARVEK